MNNAKTKNSGSFHVVAILLLFVNLVAGQANAKDVVRAFTNDTATRDLARSYKVVEVREAIAQCRAGKFKEAVPTLEVYAKAHDIAACYVLAKLYVDGLGVTKSKDRATGLLLENAGGGHTPSMVMLGQLKEDNAPVEALRLYKQAADAEDVFARVKLGNIYENGLLGTRKNARLAFKYYEKAEMAKSPLGTFQVARCYDEGIGVSPNSLESTRLFRRAAMAGIPVANTVMARRYYEGKGVEPDPVAAVGWLMRGAQAGSTEAMVLLGQRYETGDVIGRDLNKAGQMYSAAAQRGDVTGRYLLALMYLQGVGTEADPVRAYVLLEGTQAHPKAKEQFERLSKQLTPDQLKLARKKIAEAKKK